MPKFLPYNPPLKPKTRTVIIDNVVDLHKGIQIKRELTESEEKAIRKVWVVPDMRMQWIGNIPFIKGQKYSFVNGATKQEYKYTVKSKRYYKSRNRTYIVLTPVN